jgi:hypothetical protein
MGISFIEIGENIENLIIVQKNLVLEVKNDVLFEKRILKEYFIT